MTKIAIIGPSAGTGSYTLNAPETSSELSLELPVNGTHLASAQADGMPLGLDGDPVVESGSNSDGEWTRFADGTQQCRHRLLDSAGNSANGSLWFSSLPIWTFPNAFIDSSIEIAGTPRRLDVAESGVNPVSVVRATQNTLSSTSAGSLFVVYQASGSTIVTEASLLATGRWK